MNGGLEASENSRFYKEFGVKVRFNIVEDFSISQDAWKANQTDLICNTADVLPTVIPNVVSLNPEVVICIDKSRGGDAMVVSPGINTVADLKGKRIAVAMGSPSQTLLLWVLSAGGLKYSDVIIVKAPTAIDAAQYFKDKKVDACVCWNPDDGDCVAAWQGSKILKNTKEASEIIADVFYVKGSVAQAKAKQVQGFVDGWLRAAKELNADPAARAACTKLMTVIFKQPEAVMNLDNARLCTYGDNVNFFNISGSFNGIKGEDLYEKTTSAIPQLALVFKENLPDQSAVPTWRSIVNTTFIKNSSESGTGNEAEAAPTFTKATKAVAASPAMSSMHITLEFETGKYELTDQHRYQIEKNFGDLARGFAKARVRIEGNTDNVGEHAMNLSLSKKRAQSVVGHLISRYGFDPNRFIVKGNGPDKPVASNDTEEGRAQNRNVDFEMLAE